MNKTAYLWLFIDSTTGLISDVMVQSDSSPTIMKANTTVWSLLHQETGKDFEDAENKLIAYLQSEPARWNWTLRYTFGRQYAQWIELRGQRDLVPAYAPPPPRF